MAGVLYIGTRRYSSWSLRGWLLVRLAELQVEEVVIPLTTNASATIRQISPNGLVPYLEHDGAKIWESLAIAEYCAEFKPALWPAERVARAEARAMAAEMHAGFRGLRQAMPMNLGRAFPGLGQTPESLADIARIDALWSAALAASGGRFLFGSGMGAVDAMFAPVAARFITYAPALSETSRLYCETLRGHPLMAAWYAAAAAEPVSWRLDKYEMPA